MQRLVLLQLFKTLANSIQLSREGEVNSDGHTAISRKVVRKNVPATIPKGNMGYDQYTVPNTVAVEPAFVALL